MVGHYYTLLFAKSGEPEDAGKGEVHGGGKGRHRRITFEDLEAYEANPAIASNRAAVAIAITIAIGEFYG